MHDAQRIVWNTKCPRTFMFFEVVFRFFFDVIPFDFNIFVSVFTTLNMIQAKRMNEFMYNCTL